jgi:hypothetical protein
VVEEQLEAEHASATGHHVTVAAREAAAPDET